jgi:hypothetical protein
VLEVGAPGDGPYLERWHDPEKSGRLFRWSLARSRLILPVLPGKRYSLRLELSVPPQALGPETGLYVAGRLVAPLKNEPALTTTLPPTDGDTLEAELRCQGWVPQKAIPGSNDPRVLGVQVYRLAMEAEGAGAAIFNANTGQFR